MRKVLFLSAALLFTASCGTVSSGPVGVKPAAENKTAENGTVEKKAVKPEVEEVKPKAPVPERELTLEKFKHRDHMAVIRKYGCLPCHHFNVEMHVPDVSRAKVVSQKFLKPGVASCKACHTQGVTK
ncbi:hypothetical protein [Desulfurobacterium sp.]